MYFFFFSSRRRHTRYWRDWSSDVCSSDLARLRARRRRDPDLHARPGRPGARRVVGRGQPADDAGVPAPRRRGRDGGVLALRAGPQRRPPGRAAGRRRRAGREPDPAGAPVHPPPPVARPVRRGGAGVTVTLDTEVLVVGSGAGGATT